MNDIALLDATAQAELVRTKQVKPAELLEAAIERIERVNPQINAVVTPMYDEARRVAEGNLPEGPFTGVPFVLKDLGAGYAGVRQTQGSEYLKDFVSPFDSELTSRYKRAGLIIAGKTNTPEFGLIPTTEPRLFGATRNPWNSEHSVGGSSGGSAAAVAAGIVPMAHANDGGGSIRIPASCCGLFGLKPSRARVPLGPLLGDMMGGLVCEHAVTRSVRDSAALLDATAGPELGDPYYAPPQERPYVEELTTAPGKLRIAFTARTATGTPLHEDCIAAVKDAATLCEELGHDVEEAEPPPDQHGDARRVVPDDLGRRRALGHRRHWPPHRAPALAGQVRAAHMVAVRAGQANDGRRLPDRSHDDPANGTHGRLLLAAI